MFDKDRVFYKNEDYTVRMEKIGGCEKYYLQFHGQTNDSAELEITLDVFMLYYKEFKKPFDKKRNEYDRHIEDGEVDGFIISGKLTVTSLEQEYIEKAEFDAALKTCTPVQQKRLTLYHVHGYSIKEIADMENCDIAAVSRSITAAEKRVKNYFSGSQISPDL